ncbi:hypothetical protein Tco_0515403 [Tanacetum coccineum]
MSKAFDDIQERERVVSIATNATQSKGKLHEIFSNPLSITSPDADKKRVRVVSSKAIWIKFSCTKCKWDKVRISILQAAVQGLISHMRWMQISDPVNDHCQFAETKNINKSVEPKSHTQKPGRQIAKGQSDTESDKEMPPVVKSGDQDEGQAGPDPDAEATNATSQPQPGQMDEEFTTIAYPNVQENLKLTVDESVIPEEPASSTGTLPNSPNPQQVSSDSILINLLGELEQHIPDLVDANQALEEILDKHGSRMYRDLPEADMKEILYNRMWESKSYQTHEDHMTLYEALEKSMARDNRDQLLSDLGPFGTSGASGAFGSSQSPPPPPPPSNNQSGQSTSTAAPSSSKTAAFVEYTAWMMTDTRLKPSVSPIPGELHMDDDTTADEQAYSSSGEDIGHDHIPAVNLRQSWWKPITEDRPATPEPAWSIPSSDLTVPTNNWASALKSTYTPPPENSLLAQIGDMATFMDWYCKKQGISKLTQKDLEGPAYEIVKVFHPDNVRKPLPLGGDPGHVTIQPDFFFNKDLEYLSYGRKMGRPALSISKMKAAYYPDVGLEQMVPDQMWIEEECKYDVATMYGISHWWFQRQQFYIDRHTSEGDRSAVRTHMRILSVIRIEVFPMYGYNYMKKIVLRRADLKEYVIAERDFKYMYLNDFEDLHLLNLQGHLNHLSPEDKKILTTEVNLWTRNLVIRQRVEDFQLGIESYQTQTVTFRDKYGIKMIMRFNEIHKFSDGTLQQIDEALDYRVKEFRVNRMNPGLDTRFWTKKDVDRSKEFMFAIQKRLKTRRIFQNLESFVGGRIREGDYRLLKRTE